MERKLKDKQLGTITLRISQRALRYSIRISRGEVLGIIPSGGNEKCMLDFIEKNRHKLATALLKHPVKEILSDKTSLNTHTFSVRIFSTDRSNFYMSLQKGVLQIACPMGTNYETDAVQKILSQFLQRALRHEATRILPGRLKVLAERHGFGFKQVKISGSKTCWGSCSSQKNINLSYNLMLLPEHLIDYVLLHELCHTVEMSHSERFWALLNGVTQNRAKDLRRELKQYLPR